jgi:hypothetical protein
MQHRSLTGVLYSKKHFDAASLPRIRGYCCRIMQERVSICGVTNVESFPGPFLLRNYELMEVCGQMEVWGLVTKWAVLIACSVASMEVERALRRTQTSSRLV